MTITTTQKLIKIGTSRGVTLPARELEKLGVEPGDTLELVVRKKPDTIDTDQAVKIANSLLERYKEDFQNLAGR